MIDPKPGLVLHYDFLWKRDQLQGVESGKDRPCAVILTSQERADGSRDVFLCAVTHSPPGSNETAIAIPAEISRHLGLDDAPSWIKTDQVNGLNWEKGHLPYGVRKTPGGKWFYGLLPQSLSKKAFDQVIEKARTRKLTRVDRS